MHTCSLMPHTPGLPQPCGFATNFTFSSSGPAWVRGCDGDDEGGYEEKAHLRRQPNGREAATGDATLRHQGIRANLACSSETIRAIRNE